MDKDIAIYKAFEQGIKVIKNILEYDDHTTVVGDIKGEEIAYSFYNDGRIYLGDGIFTTREIN